MYMNKKQIKKLNKAVKVLRKELQCKIENIRYESDLLSAYFSLRNVIETSEYENK